MKKLLMTTIASTALLTTPIAFAQNERGAVNSQSSTQTGQSGMQNGAQGVTGSTHTGDTQTTHKRGGKKIRDLDNDGRISKEEFMQHKKSRNKDEDRATKHFNRADKNNDGYLDQEEMREWHNKIDKKIKIN